MAKNALSDLLVLRCGGLEREAAIEAQRQEQRPARHAWRRVEPGGRGEVEQGGCAHAGTGRRSRAAPGERGREGERDRDLTAGRARPDPARAAGAPSPIARPALERGRAARSRSRSWSTQIQRCDPRAAARGSEGWSRCRSRGRRGAGIAKARGEPSGKPGAARGVVHGSRSASQSRSKPITGRHADRRAHGESARRIVPARQIARRPRTGAQVARAAPAR